MDQQKLDRLAREFVAALQTDTALQERVTRRKQLSAWAQEHLTREGIPTLSESELLDFFAKLDHFILVGGAKANFDGMIRAIGLGGLRDALLNLVICGEQGLATDDLKQFFPVHLIHKIQISELMCLRFPHRYWIFNSSAAKGTRKQLDLVGAVRPEDWLNAESYQRVQKPMQRVLETLISSGVTDTDFGTVGHFLGWAWWHRIDSPPRDQVDAARSLLEHLLPMAEVRHQCLSLLAESIELAHASNDNGWGITRHSDHIRLNAGRLSAITVSRGAIELTVDMDLLDDETREGSRDGLEPWTTWGRNYPGTLAGARFAADTVPPTVPTPVLQAHTGVVERASKQVARTPSFNAYSPGLLVYLREFLGRPNLPHPSYYDSRGPVAAFDVMNAITASLAQQGLRFTPWQIATYYTALQTKGFAILSGISGTGKTKLAQHFAELLPASEGSLTHLADDVVSVTVRPYMVNYGQLTIPKAAFRLFDPPPEKASQEVTLRFKGESQDCRLTHVLYGNTDYVGVNLRGAARQWFKNAMTLGELLVLEPTVDDERHLTSLELFRAAEYTGTRIKKNGTCENLLFVPVRPDWRDSKSLLGYYNPLTSTYEWTDFLRFLQRAERSYRDADGLAWFVILDEMNLAHVEYYFADLLSVLESGRYEDGEMRGLSREPLRFTYPEDAEGDLPPRELRLPPNLYIVGTVNVDETTHAFSPKVLDRAFTLEFTDVDFAAYPPQPNGDATAQDADTARQLLTAFTQDGTFERVDKGTIAAFVAKRSEVRDHLQSLSNLLKPHDLHFGYRVFDEIVTFLRAAELNNMFADEEGDDPALDAAVLMKVLPKFHGSRGKLEAPLRAILAWCLDPDSPDRLKIDDALKNVEESDHATAHLQSLQYAHPRTATRAIRMLRALYTDGFAAFG